MRARILVALRDGELSTTQLNAAIGRGWKRTAAMREEAMRDLIAAGTVVKRVQPPPPDGKYPTTYYSLSEAGR